MERRKRIKYIKIGGGTFRMQRGKIVKPNEKFNAYPEEIPKAFYDTIIPIDDNEKVRRAQPPTKDNYTVKQTAKYEIVSVPELVEDDGASYQTILYNVVNTDSKKPINDKPVTYEAAEELLVTLQ